MHLQSGRACSNDFPSLASHIPRSTHRIKATTRSGQVRSRWQGSLPRGVARGVYIKDDAATPWTIADSSDGLGSPSSSETELLKEGTEGSEARTIHICQKATQAGSMWTIPTPKQGHECGSKGSNSRTKRF